MMVPADTVSQGGTGSPLITPQSLCDHNNQCLNNLAFDLIHVKITIARDLSNTVQHYMLYMTKTTWIHEFNFANVFHLQNLQ